MAIATAKDIDATKENARHLAFAAVRRGFDNRLWALYLIFLGASLVLFGLVTFDAAGDGALVPGFVLGAIAFAFAGAAFWKGAGG
jgi:hypothetical protein